MNWDMVSGLVRHVLTLGAGYLVAKGYFDQGVADSAIAAVMTLIALTWSVKSKAA